MKNECSVVKDLLPLYLEGLVSEETSQYIGEHLESCQSCRSALEELKAGEENMTKNEVISPKSADGSRPFKKIMKKMNRRFYFLAYSLVIFFIFLGLSLTGGENLMYNSLIMPIVGLFGYYVFRWRAVYKMPLLLLALDLFVCLFKLVELDLYSAVVWTGIYSIFVFVGIAIGALLHFAFRKERKNEETDT